MKPNHKDERGTITDLMVTPEYSITHITFERGAIRGNHYHEHTRQVDLIVSGKLLAAYKVGKIVNESIVKEGGTLTHEPGEAHAYKAIDPSEMISICFGVRKGEDYEKDVIRLDKPLLK